MSSRRGERRALLRTAIMVLVVSHAAAYALGGLQADDAYRQGTADDAVEKRRLEGRGLDALDDAAAARNRGHGAATHTQRSLVCGWSLCAGEEPAARRTARGGRSVARRGAAWAPGRRRWGARHD